MAHAITLYRTMQIWMDSPKYVRLVEIRNDNQAPLATPPKGSQCQSISDDQERLQCYDKEKLRTEANSEQRQEIPPPRPEVPAAPAPHQPLDATPPVTPPREDETSEADFVSIVDATRNEYKNGSNDFIKGAARASSRTSLSVLDRFCRARMDRDNHGTVVKFEWEGRTSRRDRSPDQS